jgi:hypothetical protein
LLRLTDKALIHCVCWIIAGSVLVSSVLAQHAKKPVFGDFRVSSIYRGAVRQPSFGNLDQYSGTDLRCFSPDPSEFSRLTVNFAGHYVLAKCTCGSGCHYLFFWDAEDGKVFRMFPFGAINVGPYRSPTGELTLHYQGEEYRADSRLLVVDGCFEGTCDCGKHYYSWSASTFQLVWKESRVPASCVP